MILNNNKFIIIIYLFFNNISIHENPILNFVHLIEDKNHNKYLYNYKLLFTDKIFHFYLYFSSIQILYVYNKKKTGIINFNEENSTENLLLVYYIYKYFFLSFFIVQNK